MTDLYALLGVPRDADRAAIRRAYWEKARVAHPDAGGSPEAFAAIKKAHDILTDEILRRRYDETGEAEEPSPDNRRAQVMEALSVALDRAIATLAKGSRPPGETDMAAMVCETLREQRTELSNQCVDLEKVLEWTRVLAGRFNAEAGENLMEGVVAGRIAACQSQLDTLTTRMTVVDDALEALRGVVYHTDPEPRPASPWQWSPFPDPLRFIRPPINE
jgi:hypothetical protein